MSEPHSFKTFNPLKNRFNPQVFLTDTLSELQNKIQLAAEEAYIAVMITVPARLYLQIRFLRSR